MNRLTALLRQREALVNESAALLDAAGEAALSAEAATRDDEIHAEIARLDGEIERENRRRQAELNAPAVGAGRVSVRDRVEDDPLWGFRSAADFGRAVREACRPGGAQMDERLLNSQRFGAAPTGYHQETGGTAGEGYMVPPQMRQEIWDGVYDPSEPDLINLVTPEPTSSNSVELLADETTPWGSTGIQAKWRSEGAQMTTSKLDTDGRQVRLHELYAFVLATEELLADAPRLNSRLTSGAARAIKYKASDALMHGTGAGQPFGFFTHGSLVSVAKESAQAADTVQAKNIAKMFARLLGGYSKAVWLTNPDVLPELFTMTLGDNSIFVPPASGFQNAPGGFLLGRPVLPNEHCKTVGDKGDILLWNPAGYYATQKAGEGIKADSSIHLYFDYGVTAFRWTFRLGGQPFLSAAVSPDNGSVTRSHAVALDARA